MVFCCKHTKRAHELITDAFRNITNKSDKGPGSGAETFRSFIPYASLYDKSCLHNVIKDYEKWMSYAKEFLKKAEEEADNCKCTELEKQKIVHLNERLQDKDKLAEERKEELSRTTNQLEKAQKRIESLETVNERFNNLRIEDVRITQENQKLKEENNKLREENLTQKINFREDKLNRLIFRLNINDNLIQKLQSAYKLSFRLQANDDNQSDIREIRKNISRAAAGNLDEAETFCELCRDIADLQVQLEQFRSEQTKGKNQALVEFSSHKNWN